MPTTMRDDPSREGAQAAHLRATDLGAPQSAVSVDVEAAHAADRTACGSDFIGPATPLAGDGGLAEVAEEGRIDGDVVGSLFELEPADAAAAVAFLRRALAFYGRYGIRVERVLSDNG